MARKRTISPGFFANESLAECSPLARLFFAGLWCWADREGRIEDRPKKLKAQILPYDDADGDALVAELTRKGFITRYVADGVGVIQIAEFAKHQHVHPKEITSSLPAMVEPRQATAEPELDNTSQRTRTSFPSLPSLPSSYPRKEAISIDAPASLPFGPTPETGKGETAPGPAGTAPPSPPTDPRFKPLREAWEQEYQAVYRDEYRWQGAKDAAGIKRVIAIPVEIFRAKARLGLKAQGFLRCGTVARLTSGEVWNQLGGPAPPGAKRVIADMPKWTPETVNGWKTLEKESKRSANEVSSPPPKPAA